MIDIKKYEQLKQKVTEAQREADMAEGALGQQMAQLEREFACKTLKQAAAKAAELEAEAEEAEAAYEAALKEFEDEWGSTLQEQGQEAAE